MNDIVASIIWFIVGLFILYIVIETAVRRGINSSIVGQYLQKKYGIKDIREKEKSFLDNDLDK